MDVSFIFETYFMIWDGLPQKILNCLSFQLGISPPVEVGKPHWLCTWQIC